MGFRVCNGPGCPLCTESASATSNDSNAPVGLHQFGLLLMKRSSAQVRPLLTFVQRLKRVANGCTIHEEAYAAKLDT
jgi:hypothetical protein